LPQAETPRCDDGMGSSSILRETGNNRRDSTLDVGPVDLVSVENAQRFTSECSLTHQGRSLMAIKEPESVSFDELVALRQFQILAHHLAHEFPKRCTRYPIQLQ